MENKIKKKTINPLLPVTDKLIPEMVANLMHNLPGMAYRCLYDEDWSMLFISEGCMNLTGYDVLELSNSEIRSYDSLIYADDRAYVRKMVDEAVARRIQFQLEYRIVHKNGEIRWVWEQGSAIYDAKNQPIWLDGYVSDISSRKRVEEELKDVAKNLVELNATKDKFFSLIAHDLQNPVYAIISLSEFLSGNARSFTQLELTSFVNQINTSAKSLYTLLENLLDWAKTQSGKVTVLKEPISLPRLINFITEQFIPLLTEKNISIVFNPERDVYVESDPRLLGTILRNLTSNAIKYSHPGTKIKISLQTEANKVYISFSDKGIGIPRRNLERIFRIDNDYKMLGTNHESGSGLGLILVKSFSEILGGEVSVFSKLNTGSTFTVSLNLPAKQESGF